MRNALVVVLLVLVPVVASADPASITIIDTYSPRANRVSWHPLVGDRGIDDVDFYRLVGREDLADQIHAHHVNIRIAEVLGAAAAVFTIYEAKMTDQSADLSPCVGLANLSAFNACQAQANATASAEGHSHEVPAILGGAATLGLFAYVLYEASTTPQMSRAEAHARAARYNAMHVTPYAAPGGAAGVSVGGAF